MPDFVRNLIMQYFGYGVMPLSIFLCCYNFTGIRCSTFSGLHLSFYTKGYLLCTFGSSVWPPHDLGGMSVTPLFAKTGLHALAIRWIPLRLYGFDLYGTRVAIQMIRKVFHCHSIKFFQIRSSPLDNLKGVAYHRDCICIY